MLTVISGYENMCAVKDDPKEQRSVNLPKSMWARLEVLSGAETVNAYLRRQLGKLIEGNGSEHAKSGSRVASGAAAR